MNACFADTSFYIALVNPNDEAHSQATRFISTYVGSIVTTSAVLNELGNYLRIPPNRTLFAAMVIKLQREPNVHIVHVDEALLHAGIELFQRRPDQEWSLTDCISFVVMEQQSIRDALTTDRHFEQAGFHRSLAEQT